ncbi:MAG: branched-chain amino acid ABC transporter permease [Streptosporangiales bacterium]|nr:branched-chain amino acid ABC transporter permease [Streptosporangiales bacterium]
MYWFSQLLNGISLGMVYYLLAAGLTLTLGVMRVVNLTHGSFYLIGGYVALSAIRAFDSHVLAAALAAAAGLVLGLVVYLLIRNVGNDLMRQATLTFGLIFVIGDLALLLWGGSIITLSTPGILSEAVHIGSFQYSSYRLFLLVLGALVAVVLELCERRTMVGAVVRAVTDDPQMAGAVGRNPAIVACATFAAGGLLAGVGGLLGGPIIGLYPGADFNVLLSAFLVVIIGGMGSLTGSLIGALVVGIVDTLGRVAFPEVGGSVLFVVMLALLALRPNGLLGARA